MGSELPRGAHRAAWECGRTCDRLEEPCRGSLLPCLPSMVRKSPGMRAPGTSWPADELEMRWKLEEEEDCEERAGKQSHGEVDAIIMRVCLTKSRERENQPRQMRTSSSWASATASSRLMRMGANGRAGGWAVPVSLAAFGSPLVPRLSPSRVRRGEETEGAPDGAGKASLLPARPRFSDPGSEVRLRGIGSSICYAICIVVECSRLSIPWQTSFSPVHKYRR